MNPFTVARIDEPGCAAAALKERGPARFIAGGTNIVDYMKCGVETPVRLVDISRLPNLDGIEVDEPGALRLGALAKMSDAHDDPDVRDAWPVVAEALELSASAQLRNMATLGGNILQRTRCSYFRNPKTFPNCNKRDPGSGCAALAGESRQFAILGTSEMCIALNPSDFAVALMAFDAVVHVLCARGETKRIDIANFYLLPDGDPSRETVLEEGDLIVSIEVPESACSGRSAYVKVRDRESYEFAVASAAVGVDIENGGTIAEARIALGGVGTVPWRCREAEAHLAGKAPDPATFREAAELALEGARTTKDNAFKVELAKRTIVKALTRVTEMNR